MLISPGDSPGQKEMSNKAAVVTDWLQTSDNQNWMESKRVDCNEALRGFSHMGNRCGPPKRILFIAFYPLK